MAIDHSALEPDSRPLYRMSGALTNIIWAHLPAYLPTSSHLSIRVVIICRVPYYPAPHGTNSRHKAFTWRGYVAL
ncbi:uncharacterized protein H6S33_001640 [Morchella sextelata]|uniref:uncharacterized protein n=1 Tax=Morchella sextelata TaxID=1174677 RepID=UPI001D0574A2|nr:uncharacterized protein H6S33_001640 [Morchella sextelata]KAH0608506.1 hypothetical protein H6S33_001640 [Morchella sextelata]